MSDTMLQDEAIAVVRRFNRFYTRQIGLLEEKLLHSSFTLTEARVLYELARQNGARPISTLGRDLLLDPGYLSRILKGFEAQGLIARSAAPHDGRQTLIALTEAGQSAFEPLNRRSQEEIRKLLARLGPEEAQRVVRCMQNLEHLLGDAPPEPPEIVLRWHQPGDLGHIASRQTILYTQEYGWDGSYEILAAEILAGFAKTCDPARERSWIAMQDGVIAGSVFLMRGSDDVGKLRLLYVEPFARRQKLGTRLVNACIDFARQAGYRTLTLWTNDVLAPARRIYQATGFSCVRAEAHHSFGKDLVGETWELSL